MANGYAKLHQRLDRVEGQLQLILELIAAQHPPAPNAELPSASAADTDDASEAQSETESKAEAEPRPIAAGVADAIAQLSAVEGAAELEARVSEAVVALSNPETLAALVRIGQLAPELEYAATILAAGPELLEEALEVVRHKLERYPDAAPRLRRLQAAVQDLDAAPLVDAVETLTQTLPSLLPLLARGASGLAAALQQVPLPQLEDSLARLTRALLNPTHQVALAETLELLPQIAYAVHGLADAQPLVDAVREAATPWASDLPTAANKLRTTAQELHALQVGPLGQEFKELLAHLGRPEVCRAIREVLEQAPQVAALTHALPLEQPTLGVARALGSAFERSGNSTHEVGPVGLFRALGDPDVRRATGLALSLARALGAHLAPVRTRMESGDM